VLPRTGQRPAADPPEARMVGGVGARKGKGSSWATFRGLQSSGDGNGF
jgi:hypothetical protein